MPLALSLAVPLGLVALLLAVLSPGASAAPLYAELGFAPVIEDEADYDENGFLDILNVSIAEPGDETLVFRFDVRDATDGIPSLANDVTGANGIEFRYDDPYDPKWLFVTTELEPLGGFTSCVVEANSLYCVAPYSALEANVGDTIAMPHARSYLQVAQDIAPGSTYFEDYGQDMSDRNGPFGIAYRLVGSTVLPPPAPEVRDMEGPAFDLSEDMEDADGATLYRWPAPAGRLDATWSATGTAGAASFWVYDAAGTELLAQDPATAGGPEVLEGEPGIWNVMVSYQGFTGSFSLRIEAPPAVETETAPPDPAQPNEPGPVARERGTEPEPGPEGGETDSAAAGADAKGTPVPLAVAAGALAVAGWKRRRTR